MPRSRLPGIARQLQSEAPDADLLGRYVQRRDADAFAHLLARYSRLVRGQCRNLLANDADADDAFQAVFLTLARSAAALKPGTPLGPWLHGVAYRVCKNARRTVARRAKRERAGARPEADRPVADSTWEGAFAAVAEEVQKLPDAQRVAFVLCCIEGRATTEAAAGLGQKLGTFSARLSRAKQTLLGRLAKRGIGAGVLALGGVTGSVSIAPAALIARTLALLPAGAAVPSSVHLLTMGVTGMTMLRFKVLAAGVMIATGLGLSVGGGWSGSATAQAPGSSGPSPLPLPAPKAPAKADPTGETLAAEVAKARALLEKMQAVEKALAFTTQALRPAPAYHYEPQAKAPTAKEFEARLAENAKAGRAFLGQVILKNPTGGEVPTLVFGEGAKPLAQWNTLGDVRNLERFSWHIDPAGLGFSEPAPPPGSTPLLDPSVNLRTELELQKRQIHDYQSSVAQLQEELARLKAKVGEAKLPAPVPLDAVAVFTEKDYGNWNVNELAEVVSKLMERDLESKKIPGPYEVYDLSKNGFRVQGSPEAVATTAAWVKKLKK